jgi:hypothetical protein
LDHTNNLFFIHPDCSYLNKSKRIIYISYHHYYPTPSGGLRATKEGTCDARESEAVRTRVQRASASSSVKSTLHPDPSTSSSVSNSGKCNTTATNVEWDPQWTPSMVAASIQPLKSSATVDKEAAREDGPSALSSTKSRTHATEVHRASSSASASHRAANSTLSRTTTSSRCSASRARPGGGPRSRS